ncbi:MAG: NADH-quinone oxidoreductase subunit NuoG [Gammaproteobacteria bacterium]|nr:NADH-quinone oxidoreductase subunit NuoG [Gammaproteobacteria bacterium]NNF61120.1 NADH-quinone oxidoreductase subunit G [Gammaproteobacteria bacterium]
MSDDQVKLEVNGVELTASKGAMIIEVTDDAGIYIPRFCYHNKLSIAANCRMCLVEVEKAPKPLPACATPVAEGMKVHTKSPAAIAAQRATMEFLLINHPLDCPICDQGGECELQDLAMGFGRDISRYQERKRVVPDKDIGPLVSTDMTRCIHCTRCVRFTEEVAGLQELGTLGRGENMEIGTYIERSVDHELSGNVIDLCPVGALNSRPFRFRARSWEMIQQATVSPHDSVGSNLYAHVLQGRLMRIVPRPNESLNETWISDRDRFSYAGIYSDDRLQTPVFRVDGEFRPVSWSAALDRVAERLRPTEGELGVLAAPGATLEEHYLLQKLARDLESNNVDHRLRASDLSDQSNDPQFPTLGVTLAALEQADAIAIIGSNIRHEAPILAHRVRKAALAGAQVSIVNPPDYEYLFPVHAYAAAPLTALHTQLAALLGAVEQASGRSSGLSVERGSADGPIRAIAESLVKGDKSHLVLGALSCRHPGFAQLRALAGAIAELSGATVGCLPDGANAAGAYLAGMVPHRGPGGAAAQAPGKTARQMLSEPCASYVLFGFEPQHDTAEGQAAIEALREASFVVMFSPWLDPTAVEYADVILPIGTFAETAGSFVNLQGDLQTFSGVARPVGEARPGWKVLRVLGNQLGLSGYEYRDAGEVLAAARADIGPIRADSSTSGVPMFNGAQYSEDQMPADVPLYAADSLVRRSRPLQRTRSGREGGSA